jgi:hypothetical protein
VFDFENLQPYFNTKTSTMIEKLIDASVPFYPEN